MKKFFILSALACGAVAHANLIPNGDFEGGVSNFVSDYTLTGDLHPAATYNVGTDAHLFHEAWTSFGDHTSGAGKMMIMNGGGDSSARVWQGDSINLAAGTYTFSFYGASTYPDNPANLTVSLNNSVLGSTGVFSANPGTWNLYSFTFSTAGGASTFVLRDSITAAGGNDFVIDDINLQAVPEPTTVAALGLGALGLLKRRKKA